MLNNVVFLSAVQQHDSAISMHNPIRLEPPSQPRFIPPSRSSQGSQLSSLHSIATISIVMYILPCYSPSDLEF